MERLQEEFIPYLLLEESGVAVDVWKKAAIYIHDSTTPHVCSMDAVWATLQLEQTDNFSLLDFALACLHAPRSAYHVPAREIDLTDTPLDLIHAEAQLLDLLTHTAISFIEFLYKSCYSF